ncbi:MAG: peptidyl-prolyl cis-trans isomerase [Kiritimatiellae bacterium]|nr:peptidyl-prolyl cis-trans isomerase [Kiritimatiellia bacterium]
MNTHVAIETTKGTMEADLFDEQAPKTVANFLRYADEKFYDGTVFHRVIPGFMIQGGGFTADMEQKDTHAPVQNEARNRISNERGTLAMARTQVVDSATCQFFVNHADNAFLDFREPTAQGFGYCVFGKLTSGFDVLDAIAKVATGTHGFHRDVPVEPVTILSIRRVPASAE